MFTAWYCSTNGNCSIRNSKMKSSVNTENYIYSCLGKFPVNPEHAEGVRTAERTLIIPSQHRWRGYSNAAVRGWLGEWVHGFVGGCVRMCVRHTLPSLDTIVTAVFAQSLSNFTLSCGWWEEEPFWFWVTGSKVKVNCSTLSIRPCGLYSDYSFCQITFKLHM